MEDSHEVDPFFDEWWTEDWRMHVLPVVGTVGLVIDRDGLRINRDERRPDPDYRKGDRVLWWKYDQDSNEVRVRVPRDESLSPDEGLWLEKRYHLTDDGRVVATGHIELRDFDRNDPLTSELQAAIGLRGINRQIERQLRVVARRMGLGASWERATVDVRRPGRPGMSVLELAEWAERFVEALAVDPRRPYRVLAERYPGWSDSGLKSIVRRARKSDPPLLTEVRQGQTGGELTDAARRILNEGNL